MFTLLFVPIFNESWAQEFPNDEFTPIMYNPGINLMNIDKINEKAGTYWLDFFFYIRSDGVDFTQGIPEIIFMNARDVELGEPYITPRQIIIKCGVYASELIPLTNLNFC